MVYRRSFWRTMTFNGVVLPIFTAGATVALIVLCYAATQ